MTVVFDAEPLLAFSFDEPGAGEVKHWLDQVYDGDLEGYISTLNLTEFRYIAVRKASVEQADAQIENFRDMGVTAYNVDDLWKAASEVKAEHNPSLGDAYAVATAKAKALDNDDEEKVTLLVGADGDYNSFENDESYEHLLERFRDQPA